MLQCILDESLLSVLPQLMLQCNEVGLISSTEVHVLNQMPTFETALCEELHNAKRWALPLPMPPGELIKL